MRLHLAAWLGVCGGLFVVNWLIGGYAWSLWIAAAWAGALAVHALIHRARTTDEDWAEARAEDVRSKSYDASHIDSIKERYGGEPPSEKDKPG